MNKKLKAKILCRGIWYRFWSCSNKFNFSKDSLFNADINLVTYVFYELETEGLPFANLAFENLVYLDEKGDYDYAICEGISINTEDENFFLIGEGVNLRIQQRG